MILIIAAIVVATAAGIGAERRWPERAGHDSRRALVWILYLVLPPVTFFNLVHVSFDADLGGGIGLGWIATTVAALAAWGLGARVLELTRPQTGAVITCTLVANTAYLGYPLTVALLGSDELGKAVAYDVAVGGPALLIGAFAAGAAFGTKAGQGPRQRTGAFFARNMPLYAAVLALLAPDSFAPDVLVDISRIVVVAILPIGFFAVGAALMEDAGPAGLRMPPPLSRATAGVIGTKLVAAAGPALPARPAADRPAEHLPADGGDAVRAQLDDRRSRLRPRSADDRGGGHLDDGDRRRRRPRRQPALRLSRRRPRAWPGASPRATPPGRSPSAPASPTRRSRPRSRTARG